MHIPPRIFYHDTNILFQNSDESFSSSYGGGKLVEVKVRKKLIASGVI